MPHDDDLTPLIGKVAESLRQPVPLSADFDARVMAQVRAARPASLPVRAWDWLREPRAVVMSPMAGLALAASVAIIVLGAGAVVFGSQRVTASATSGAAPGRETPNDVQFVFLAPRAHTVALAGDFNGWDAAHTPLARSASGLWTVDVPLAPGRYTYAFVVDGRRFVPDPAAPRSAGDDFGTPSSVVTVQGQGGGS